MAITIGRIAPDFELPSTANKKLVLSKDFGGKPVILFFFPKAFTKVCTAEACSFGSGFEEFNNLGIPVLGISTDDLPTLQRFKKTYNLPFELASDKDAKVSKLYQAKMPFLPMSLRITYLLDGEHKVQAVFSGLFEGEKHVQEMLAKAGTVGHI